MNIEELRKEILDCLENVKNTLTINDEIIVADFRDISKDEYENFFLFCENIGFEENYVTYKQYYYLKQKYRVNNLAETENIVEKLRAVKDKDEIVSYLRETKTLLTVSSNNPKDGKKAITRYRVVARNNNYSLLDISLRTGRKNQIRVHMKDMNHPIVGDSKYGLKDGFRRMYLHAYKLSLTLPGSDKLMTFETDVPNEFIKLIEK